MLLSLRHQDLDCGLVHLASALAGSLRRGDLLNLAGVCPVSENSQRISRETYQQNAGTGACPPGTEASHPPPLAEDRRVPFACPHAGDACAHEG